MNTHNSLHKQPLLLLLVLMQFATIGAFSQSLPYTIKNNSTYLDNEIYVGVVGIKNGAHVWVDCKTGTVNPMSPSYNTVTGPSYSGNMGPGGNAKYADCFSKLSDIPNKTVSLPYIEGCRMFYAFKSPLYFYFFGSTGAPSGYAGPNLANPTDPNLGIRFEIIELTNGSNGLWVNTTRVDAYQYPMGLEVWGNSFYKKVGELLTHNQIVAQWKASAPSEFQACLDKDGVIQNPSKVASFQNGGTSANYFNPYIDAIWAKYSNEDVIFSAGNEGVWHGRANGGQFKFTRPSDGATAYIQRKPTNIEVLEGSGALASGSRLDLVLQAQFCAAINRHAINLNVSGVQQDWSDDTKYYQTPLYNWYCKFWHQSTVSFDKMTYAFCYDDVFDKSSTINCSSPTLVCVTIGGFAQANITQTISLNKGWNLISTNVCPPDSTIETLFTGLDVQEIKTMDSFWYKTQSDPFNGLKTIVAGKAYLVNMNTAATLSVTGTALVETQYVASLQQGWQLIGCPYQSSVLFSSQFSATNCEAIKNFEGFWKPNDQANSIDSFIAGKGYFLKSK